MYSLSLTFTLFACAFALGSWNDFNGNFLMTTASGGAGTVTGSVIWSWTQGKMFVSFNTGTSQTWTETYTWNSTKGFTGNGADAPQYLFTYGSSCSPACSAASISNGIPLLNPSGSYLSSGTGSGECKTYTPVASGTNSFMTFMTASETKVCSFSISDGRLFTMTSFTKSASTIQTPSSCSCSQAVDIMFLVDHSSSIDWNEMKEFKKFVQKFIDGLTISASAVNVGMTYFSKATTTLTGSNFPMTGEPDVVVSGMTGWQVPCSSNNAKCVLGGATATPYGITAAANALYASPRQVPKILMILTDGATNTGLNNKGCCNNKLTDSFQGCNPDIDTSINYLKAKKNAQSYQHSLTMISVGIGKECTSQQRGECSSSCRYSGHLLKFADNIPSNMLSVDDWDALQAQVASLMSLTCSTSNNAQQTACLQQCGGLCVCGTCSPPTGCTNTSNCFSYALTGNPAQCQPAAIPCPSQTCKVSTCDSSLNACTYQDTDCSALRGGCNGCRRYTCSMLGDQAGQCVVPDDSLCGATVNCAQTAWGSWTACTATCGGGTQSGTRTISTQPKNCGAECGATSTTVECNTQSCATPCVTTDWTVWGPCTATCGGGSQTQTRRITANPTNGGQACGVLTQSTSCNSNGCPVNCSWYPWGTWTPCSVSCGEGTTHASRSVKVQSSHGGAECTGEATKSTTCQDRGCPVNCVWTPWSDYGSCSQTCGTGTQSRNRTQTTPVENGGIPCDGGFAETQDCSLRLCPVPCAWGDWGNYGPCSVTCAAGSATRSRSISQVALNGATPCNPDNGMSTTGCNLGPCPIACVWGTWSPWGDCSVTCGGGNQIATRNQTTVAQYNGTACPGGFTTTQQCGTNGCPVNCTWSGWSSWSSCSKSCGGGVNTQSRTISVAAINGGVQCNLTDTTKYGPCNTTACPIDCVWGPWSVYENCSVTCGGGTQRSTREIATPSDFGGLVCGNIFTQNRTCSPDPCPIPCVGAFLPWSDCHCSDWNQTQTFSISVPAQYNGAECEHENGYVVAKTCTPPANCRPVNCEGGWGPNSTCTCVSPTNQTFRIYTVTVPSASGGDECPYSTGFKDLLYCDPVECPVDCQGEWSSWTTCACDNTTTQTFTITRPRQYAGASCDFLDGTVNTTSCDPVGCPFDCRGHWEPWATCDCATKSQWRIYTEDEPLLFGGKPCDPVGETNQIQACAPEGCDVDCEGFYSVYSECACATNITTRYWTLTREYEYNGTRCNLTDGEGEDHACVAQGCPADCEGDWGPYGSCSCSNNLQNRTFILQNLQRFGGKGCEAKDGDIGFGNCDPFECPEPCVGAWTVWSECFCESSTKTRSFHIDKDALFGGEPCVALDNTGDSTGCTPYGCPVNCSGIWSNWSDCSCVTGNETRSYSILIPRGFAGDDCPFSNSETESQACNTSLCPVDCQGNWNDWKICSCQNNTQSRSWKETVTAKNGGAACPGRQARSCSPIECPVDCKGYWGAWGFCPCGPAGETSSYQNRTFTVLTPVEFAGKACEAVAGAVQNQSCTAVECPVDCIGKWGGWGNCSCETLTRSQTFTITRNQSFNGNFCVAASGDSRSENCEPENCKTYPPPCKGPDDHDSCLDVSLCTQNRCILFDDNQYHCDWSLPVDCNDDSVCTSESCDELQGCIYVPLICNDNNACSRDTCDNVTGCKFQNITCTVNSTEWCSEPICDSVTGCGKAAKICPDVNNEVDNCTQMICDPDAKDRASACSAVQLCGFDPIFIAITGAAIAGIAVACGVVALAAVSGASYAIATQTGATAATTTLGNPLYVGDATSGVNQLGEVPQW